MLAKDIMRKRVVTVTPQMTLREAGKLFSGRGISGAPVVSPQGEVIGVLSQTDMLRREMESSAAEVPHYHRESEEWDGSEGFPYEDCGHVRVEQVMTPWAITVEAGTPVRELARQMLGKHIHRILITRGGRLCGIVTSMDMLRALLKLCDIMEPASV